ncbi:MAG TPA: hypothetical protein VFE53_25065 [Mucilaginibacter sp.]|jgi:uncharacterized membrane protein|nr:hypothetical protein [Mucilaginibacter sp.]
MGNLSNIGRIFYGMAVAEMGAQTIYYHDFPYMLLPPNHSSVPGFMILAYISGILFVLAAACIVSRKKARPIALLLAGMLLSIFCFYYVPYEFIAASNYMHFGEWENAAKELALAGGAFVITGCFQEKNENPGTRFLGKLIPYGTIIFSITIISFGINHFLYAKGVADYMPSWIPDHMFWIYLAGAALLASGIGISLNIWRGTAATLLGVMILIWFLILHIPKVITAPAADRKDEITSAILALAYSGIAFVIAGAAKRNSLNAV